MNKIKSLFLHILQGKIHYKDKIVPVVIKDYWIDKTPCITIYGVSRDKYNYRRQTVQVKKPLNDTHPLYDSKHPNKRFPHLAERTGHSYDIQINVWCNDEYERDCIVRQVKQQLFLARNHHYTFCTKYDKESKQCKTTGETCEAITDKGFKGLRGLCPNPRKNKCCNVFKAYNVIGNTVHISDDYEQDEYDHKPPLKRSIIDVSLDYYNYNVFPSNPVYCLGFDFT